jgi:SAM-dependent methyltransferase
MPKDHMSKEILMGEGSRIAAEKSARSLTWNGHTGQVITKVKEFDIIACGPCGFRHVVPLPDPAELDGVYREEYYTLEKPNFIAYAQEDQEWAELAQTDRLAIFERLLPRERRRLLDIGCGPGWFLKTAKERGWQVRGIEPSRQAAAHARSLGIEMVEGFFSARSAPALGNFDTVHLNNVLEHVPNPIEVLTLARDVLSPGGLLCVNVPNDFTPFQRSAAAALSLSEWWVAPPHHLNYFDFDSLAALYQRLGFTSLERTTSFPMEQFLMMGLDYTTDPALGRACHAQRKSFDLALERAGFTETRRAFYRALAEIGLGREAVLIGSKT